MSVAISEQPGYPYLHRFVQRGDDGKRFHERLADFEDFIERQVEPFIYSRSEIQALFEQRHTLLLEALADGWALFDQGGWAALRAELEAWQRDRKAIRGSRGWWLDPTLKPATGGNG